MENDLTLTADRLLVSNPTEATKQGIASKGFYTIGDVFETIKSENENNDEFRFSDFSARFCHKPAKNQKNCTKAA